MKRRSKIILIIIVLMGIMLGYPISQVRASSAEETRKDYERKWMQESIIDATTDKSQLLDYIVLYLRAYEFNKSSLNGI